MSAGKSEIRQTYFYFLWFCLPAGVEPDRHFLVFFAFVCRHQLNPADIFLLSLVLSADISGTRQTFSCFLCFCLPTQVVPGRHFLVFFGFVCRQKLNPANIFLVSLLLSADTSGIRQTFFWFLCFCLPTKKVVRKCTLILAGLLLRSTPRKKDR